MTREEAIAQLHERYVKASGRPEPIRFHREAWQRLASIEEYGGDVALLTRDVAFVVWYLKGQIRRDRRMPGSLRLRNLLMPDQFLSDLAEAIADNPQAWHKHCAKHGAAAPAPHTEPAAPAPAPEQVGKAGAAALREFAGKLMGEGVVE